MLHDLALALGGMTVTELKERMPHTELMRWLEYRKVYGPLNPMLRNDAAIARLGIRMAGGKFEDYCPWPKIPPKEVTPESMMKALQFSFAGNKK